MKPMTPDSRDLQFRDYRAGTISVPANFGNYRLIPPGTWGMLGNAVYGCCFPAGQDHAEKQWTAAGTGTPINVTVNNTLSDYFAMNGVAPGPPQSASDQGTDPRAGLQYHMNVGMLDATGQRHKLGAYLQLKQDPVELAEACYLTGVVGLGIDCPQSAQDQFPSGYWTIVPGSPSDGLHWVVVVGRWAGWWEVISWGKRIHVSEDFIMQRWVVAYAMLSPEAINAGTHVSREGLSYPAIQADVQAVTQQ
jgi:hypothetical protein